MSKNEYIPIVKAKNFLPNPVAVNGIPDFADSSRDSSVIGTAKWEDWWIEQFYYCINGYETGGFKIPGRYYYYLNFFILNTPGIGNHYPMYVDLDYEFFLLLEDVKRKNQGIISLKARRKGLSYKVVGAVIDYGFRFGDHYTAGICAGLEEHSQDFYEKFKTSNSLKPLELMMNIKMDKDKARHIYEIRKNGIWTEGGTRNTLHVATMFQNPNVFKGKALDDCVFEESGEFPKLKSGYDATKPCFMVGDVMVGTPFVYGTGGNMSKGSADFADMWHDNEAYNLRKFWVPANRLLLHCIGGITGSVMDPKNKIEEDTPNLKEYKPYQRIGMEDVERAKDRLLEDRDKKLRAKNKQTYYEHVQNYPLTEKEAFMRFSGNHFNPEIINDKLFEIDSQGIKYTYYKLDWKKDDKGVVKFPLGVEAIVVTDEELRDRSFLEKERVVMVLKKPRPDYEGLDIAGLDSYDLDKSISSKSLGAMVVYRRKHSIPDAESQLPVALVNYRPVRKEIFYDACAMTAVWFNIVGNVLIDVDKAQVIKHFEEVGCGKYLAERPRTFDSPNTQQLHKIGVKLNTYSKPLMIGLIQSYFEDHVGKVEYPQILNEALDYDIAQRDSDWDTIDALGIALMRDKDMEGDPYDRNKEDKEEDYDMGEWVEGPDGNLIKMSSKEAEEYRLRSSLMTGYDDY